MPFLCFRLINDLLQKKIFLLEKGQNKKIKDYYLEILALVIFSNISFQKLNAIKRKMEMLQISLASAWKITGLRVEAKMAMLTTQNSTCTHYHLYCPKPFLVKVKEESEKVGLKLNIQKSKITASGPITSWEIDGETVETVSDFIFLGSKITVDGDCSHEIKRRLLLGKKVMTNLDSFLKSRDGDVTLPTKVHLVKAMVFPVVMYGCESWTIKKAECQRIDAFELWCWRRLLRVP